MANSSISSVMNYLGVGRGWEKWQSRDVWVFVNKIILTVGVFMNVRVLMNVLFFTFQIHEIYYLL